jgi:hypothetical protein
LRRSQDSARSLVVHGRLAQWGSSPASAG